MVFKNCLIPCILLLTAIVEAATSRHPFRHEAVEVRRRQAAMRREMSSANALSSISSSTSTSTSETILTYITPSPGASAIPVTEQSQLVSSSVPIFTLCALPPVAFIPTTATLTQSTAPYHNYSISIPPGPGTCTTVFSPTVTMVCATTLTGIDRVYPVSECNQQITYSSQYGYVLATPTPTPSANTTDSTDPSAVAAAMITPAPSIQTLTTYFVAGWQDLTRPGLAPQDIEQKVCFTYPNGTESCVVEYYTWSTSLATITTSTITSINFTTTVAGPSQIVVETFVANVTAAMTTFSMETAMGLTWSLETETTEMVPKTTQSGVSTRPTVTATYTVSGVDAEEPTTTRTSTMQITRTVYGGTVTTTVPRPTDTASAETASAAESGEVATEQSAPTTSIDAASILGVGS